MPARRGMALALAVLLCVFALMGFAPARAEPADAVLAPITVKPWLRPATPVPSEAPVPTETPAPDASPPSSLSILEEEQSPAVQPTPLPTAEPALLPGVLGLADATRFRLLLIGTDAYDPDDAGRSDTMVLLQVQPATGEIRLVSFLRDLYVAVPGHGHTRLNAAYVYGGASLLLRTLKQSFGVTADRTLAVNFSRMAELIDRIGGVTVEVSEKERRQLNSILKYYNTQVGDPRGDQLLGASGSQTLTGKQALCYSRIRKMDSDFARTGRQRKVLEAIFARVRRGAVGAAGVAGRALRTLAARRSAVVRVMSASPRSRPRCRPRRARPAHPSDRRFFPATPRCDRWRAGAPRPAAPAGRIRAAPRASRRTRRCRVRPG